MTQCAKFHKKHVLYLSFMFIFELFNSRVAIKSGSKPTYIIKIIQ